MNREERAEELKLRQKRDEIDRNLRGIFKDQQKRLDFLMYLAVNSVIYRVNQDLTCALVLVVDENRINDPNPDTALMKGLTFAEEMKELKFVALRDGAQLRGTTFRFIIEDPKGDIILNISPNDFFI